MWRLLFAVLGWLAMLELSSGVDIWQLAQQEEFTESRQLMVNLASREDLPKDYLASEP